jgi:hypothetical protein
MKKGMAYIGTEKLPDGSHVGLVTMKLESGYYRMETRKSFSEQGQALMAANGLIEELKSKALISNVKQTNGVRING